LFSIASIGVFKSDVINSDANWIFFLYVWFQRENLEMFLKGCEAYGLKSHDLFVVNDLYEHKNLYMVINSTTVMLHLSLHTSTHIKRYLSFDAAAVLEF